MPADPLRVFLNASALPERPAGAGIYTLELAAPWLAVATSISPSPLLDHTPWKAQRCFPPRRAP